MEIRLPAHTQALTLCGLAVTHVADRRKRYRKRDARQDTNAALERQDPATRWERITELSQHLTGLLDDQAREVWHELEQALHVHWLEVAVAHYNRGYAAGRAQSWVHAQLAGGDEVQEKLRAMGTALVELADALEQSKQGAAH